MSTVASDTASWIVVYPDGRFVTDEERHWFELSVPRQYGSETLFVLSQPAVSLAAQVGGRWHELRAPLGMDAHFFRYYRHRSSLMNSDRVSLYHAIGYVCDAGRLWLEIDPRGDSKLRFEPAL